MRAVITGANSFIGKRLQGVLLNKGWEIIAVTRKCTEENANVRNVTMTMQEYHNLGRILGSFDCLIHLAWNGTRGADRMDAEMQNKNVEYSLDAVRAALEVGCKKVITAGSQAEYGPHNDRITEESECRPNTEYGKAKLSFYQKAAKLCAEYGAVCIEPRFFSLYGPDDYKDTMVISTLRHLLSGEECLLTQGIQMWDYLHIDDACNALSALCIKEDVPAGVYNFGSGDVRPLKDYILQMQAIAGGTGKLNFGAIPYPPTGMVSLWPDVTKLKTAINWKPQTTFETGIREIVETMKR